MASTNKTTYYELSQYVSSDKPTYLVDYNGDMSKIDTGIHTAKTTADGAATAAGNAQTAAEGAQTTANTAITNAATADGKATTANTNIGTLANLTTTDKTDLVSAINEVDSNADSATTLATTANTEIAKLEGVVVYTNVQGLSTSDTITGYKLSDYKRVKIEYIDNTNNYHEYEMEVESSTEKCRLSNLQWIPSLNRMILQSAECTFTESGSNTTITLSEVGWMRIDIDGLIGGESLSGVLKVTKVTFYNI